MWLCFVYEMFMENQQFLLDQSVPMSQASFERGFRIGLFLIESQLGVGSFASV
jgi:hypothetical protein